MRPANLPLSAALRGAAGEDSGAASAIAVTRSFGRGRRRARRRRGCGVTRRSTSRSGCELALERVRSARPRARRWLRAVAARARRALRVFVTSRGRGDERVGAVARLERARRRSASAARSATLRSCSAVVCAARRRPRGDLARLVRGGRPAVRRAAVVAATSALGVDALGRRRRGAGCERVGAAGLRAAVLRAVVLRAAWSRLARRCWWWWCCWPCGDQPLWMRPGQCIRTKELTAFSVEHLFVNRTRLLLHESATGL